MVEVNPPPAVDLFSVDGATGGKSDVVEVEMDGDFLEIFVFGFDGSGSRSDRYGERSIRPECYFFFSFVASDKFPG